MNEHKNGLPNATKPERTRRAQAAEIRAIRTIGRAIEELEEPTRARVLGAVRALYFGPDPLA